MMASEPTLDGRRPVVAVFARTPLPGRVKTRLARDLGDDGALATHLALLRDLLGALAGQPDFDVELWLSDGTTPEVDALGQQYRVAVRVQAGADLGQRMCRTIDTLLAANRLPLVVGSDVLGLDAAQIRKAFNALREADLVLAPVDDGGYGLIGMSRLHAAVFDAIPWGSDQVMAETRRRARRLGLRCFELEGCWDLDTIEDYLRWNAHRGGNPA